MIAYVFVAMAFLVLRRREPALHRPFLVPHGSLVGGAALALGLGLILLYLPGSPSALLWPQEWIIVLSWALLGVVVYVKYRPHSEPGDIRGDIDIKGATADPNGPAARTGHS
jgi:amino acid transporter